MALPRQTRFASIVALMVTAAWVTPAVAQTAAYTVSPSLTRDYVVGSQDVLNITSQDDPTLSGKFTVEADLTFTFPLLGRVRAGGLTLRAVESQLQAMLVEGGFFKEPQIMVSIEQYKSQKVFIVGEVRNPGAYALSGDMRLVEALALAGSTLPTASGEAVIVHPSAEAFVVQPALDPLAPEDGEGDPAHVLRVDLHELENGDASQNAP